MQEGGLASACWWVGTPGIVLFHQGTAVLQGGPIFQNFILLFLPHFPTFWDVFRGAEALSKGNSPAVIMMVQCSGAAFRSATLIVTHSFG